MYNFLFIVLDTEFHNTVRWDVISVFILHAVLNCSLCKFQNYQFQVIGSLSDTLRSVSLETSSEIPLYDIEIGNPNGTLTENSTTIATVTNKVDESTPLANNSLNLMSGDSGQNTEIFTQSVTKSSSIDSRNLSVYPFHGNITEALDCSLKSKIYIFMITTFIWSVDCTSQKKECMIR